MESQMSHKQPRRTLRRRRAEIERRLAELALTRGRFPRAVDAADGPPPSLRLRRGLESLGPVFTALGRYLASRVDLLTTQQSRDLAAIPDQGPATPPALVETLIRDQLGRVPEDVYESFEPLPFESGLLVQRHRARLSGGPPVVVSVVHPELDEALACDPELVPVAVRELARGVLPLPDPDGVAADFLETFVQAIDLAGQAEALEKLRLGATLGDLVRLPSFELRLTAPRVSTREDLGGTTLAELLSRPEDAAGSEAAARRLCELWLRLAVRGRAYPAAPDPRAIEVLSDQRIAWTEGPVGRLPAATRERLWKYLNAAAARDPDRALDALLEEMEEPPATGIAALRQRFRQAVPFRDGGLGAVDDLAGNLFLHWRLAGQLGCRPRPHLVRFYRGLAGLAAPLRELSPGTDPWLASVEAVRLGERFGELGQLLDPRHMGGQAEESLKLALSLPKKIDQVLSLAAGGQATFKLDMVEPPAERRRKNATSAAVALLLSMVAVGVLAHHLAALALGEWIERAAAAAFLALGVALLRTVFARRP